ncbi:transposase domain-containing protein [Streptomyces sp. NPDC004752]
MDGERLAPSALMQDFARGLLVVGLHMPEPGIRNGPVTTGFPWMEETRAAQRRLRDLPSRVGVYLLLAMCLFLPRRRSATGCSGTS